MFQFNYRTAKWLAVTPWHIIAVSKCEVVFFWMLTGLHNIPARNIRHGLILISSASFFRSDLRTVRKHGSLRDNNAGKICVAALGGTSFFPSGKRRRQGEEVLNNMGGKRGERRKGYFLDGRMDGTLVTWWTADWGTFHGGEGAVSVFFILQFLSYIYVIYLLASIKFNYK